MARDQASSKFLGTKSGQLISPPSTFPNFGVEFCGTRGTKGEAETTRGRRPKIPLPVVGTRIDMGDEALESGFDPSEWGHTALPTAEKDEVAVMLRLLSPPTVPDTVWFSHATRALLQCDPCRLVTRPRENKGARLMVECLAGGAFRSQSAVLDYLKEAAAAEGGEVVLGMMAGDDDMPVLRAALRLCREQEQVRGEEEGLPAAVALEEEVSAGGEDDGGGEEEDNDGDDHDHEKDGAGREEEEEEENEKAPPRRVLVRQNCCEDPFDCEEPAVWPQQGAQQHTALPNAGRSNKARCHNMIRDDSAGHTREHAHAHAHDARKRACRAPLPPPGSPPLSLTLDLSGSRGGARAPRMHIAAHMRLATRPRGRRLPPLGHAAPVHRWCRGYEGCARGHAGFEPISREGSWQGPGQAPADTDAQGVCQDVLEVHPAAPSTGGNTPTHDRLRVTGFSPRRSEAQQ